MAERDTLTIRIDPNLKKALARAAKEDDRSVTSFVVHACHKEIEARKRSKDPVLSMTRELGTNRLKDPVIPPSLGEPFLREK